MLSRFPQSVSFSARRFVFTLAVAFIVPVLSLLSGCSGGTVSQSFVEGKVSLDEQPVAGKVVFVGDSGKKFETLTDDEGKYRLNDVLPGKYKVQIEALPGAGKDAPKFEPPMKDKLEIKKGMPPPEKYRSIATSGLEYEMTKGKQTKDFPLAK